MNRTGLVLSGGGARGAYQVGVLKGIAALLPHLHYPFPIICGTSAGAINAVGLGCSGDRFHNSIEMLEALWLHLRCREVYRTDFWGVARQLTRFARVFGSGETGELPASLLDNSPLRNFLQQHIDFAQLQYNIRHSDIQAVCVTACGYQSGQSVSFFEAGKELAGWHLGQRIGISTRLTIGHLMASSAIPTLFPPELINREYFGDGVVRNMAPLSPAIHLGANRILVIGVSANRVCPAVRQPVNAAPKLPRVLEHLLNGAFIDTSENDIDHALLINQLLTMIPPEQRKRCGLALKPLEMLLISPSAPIDVIAHRHQHLLPGPVRRFLGSGGDEMPNGSSMASYLLFERPFLQDLIELGYHDAMSHARQIGAFLEQPCVPSADAGM